MAEPDSEKIFAPEKNAARAFHHRETAVCVRLGISRDTALELRRLYMTEGLHWSHTGRRILLSDAGIAVLTSQLKLAPESAHAPTQEVPRPLTRLLIGPPGFPGGLPAPVVLKAWESPARNTSILIAYLRGTDPQMRANRVRVRVQDNTHFVRHMEVPARLISPPDLYECTRPAPRERGCW